MTCQGRPRKRSNGFIVAVLELTASGMSRNEVAKLMGVSKGTVCGIVYRYNPHSADAKCAPNIERMTG